ncbi:hypothetical protein [Adhaeribacter rhizoryzae]|uniref:Uncharacterized protein n=1 Tax=Adhaeribacter rhizoryzae TaxID=2607907 RepID=A0A5M6D2Q1_9BACT|nr:hypothetical protein [Adhaeribacter rhizoryzae]KAA5541613.1 hypothetical protein F0145_20590 [Adhaeribacter rhizoryzae]
MRPKSVETIARYIHIAGKLQRTIIVNQGKFPELQHLQDKIINIPIDRTQPNPFLNHLEKICQLLKDNSHTYIVRHLHYNFNKDVEALAEDRELLDLNYYLNYIE